MAFALMKGFEEHGAKSILVSNLCLDQPKPINVGDRDVLRFVRKWALFEVREALRKLVRAARKGMRYQNWLIEMDWEGHVWVSLMRWVVFRRLMPRQYAREALNVLQIGLLTKTRLEGPWLDLAACYSNSLLRVYDQRNVYEMDTQRAYVKEEKEEYLRWIVPTASVVFMSWENVLKFIEDMPREEVPLCLNDKMDLTLRVLRDVVVRGEKEFERETLEVQAAVARHSDELSADIMKALQEREVAKAEMMRALETLEAMKMRRQRSTSNL
jgi:hypothetical protein